LLKGKYLLKKLITIIVVVITIIDLPDDKKRKHEMSTAASLLSPCSALPEPT